MATVSGRFALFIAWRCVKHLLRRLLGERLHSHAPLALHSPLPQLRSSCCLQHFLIPQCCRVWLRSRLCHPPVLIHSSTLPHTLHCWSSSFHTCLTLAAHPLTNSRLLSAVLVSCLLTTICTCSPLYSHYTAQLHMTFLLLSPICFLASVTIWISPA